MTKRKDKQFSGQVAKMIDLNRHLPDDLYGNYEEFLAQNLPELIEQELSRLTPDCSGVNETLFEDYNSPLSEVEYELHCSEELESEVQKLFSSPDFPPQLRKLFEIWGYSRFKLGTSVGSHNFQTLYQPQVDSAVRKSQAEQVNSRNKFNNKYSRGLEIMEAIVLDFYQDPENLNYNVRLILELIEDLCVKNGIAYPKDPNSDSFKQHLERVKMKIGMELSQKGSPPKKYRQIDTEKYQARYQKMFFDNSAVTP